MRVQCCLPALLLLFISSCRKDKDAGQDTTPQFLLTGWILPIANNAAKTYDFTQLQAAGRRTAEIRTWQLIGTLGWQSYQQFTAIYEATDKRVVMTSPTGYRETWDILSVEGTKILVNLNGQQTYIYNCSEPGWPELIRLSTRGCR